MDEIIQINSQLQTNINLPCTTFALLGHYAATIKNGRVMHKNAIFAKEISDSRRNCGGENGTLLVNEFCRNCLQAKRNFIITRTDDNYK